MRLLLVVLLLAACAGASSPGGPAPASAPYDLVITNGKIVDGTGAAWYYGDLAIGGDRIAAMTPAGLLRDAPARERIDAAGHVVAPGFIDIQGHSRGAFLGQADGRVVSKVTQGITTEIMGEGATNAPQNARTGRQGRFDFSGPRGFDRWLQAMVDGGPSVNVGSFVGASTLRMYGKGMAEGPATPAELDSMRLATRNAMEDGAFGIASALIYPPGNFASTDELIELVRVTAPYGGVYITHMRSEADQLLEAIREALRIGREGGVPVEIYHLKAAGQRNWARMADAIALIDSARAAGQDVQADMYLYTAGGTGLAACLPPWASADGRLFQNLEDSATVARLIREMQQVQTDWENLCQLATPEGVLVMGLDAESTRGWVGRRLGEIAAAMGHGPERTIIELLLAERSNIGTVFFLMSEDNIRLQLRQPWIKFGTDAPGLDPDSARGLTHPRAYGNFPRLMGRYVREQQVIPLEDAVRKASSAVATRLSLHDRGVLRPGMYADVIVFDPRTIADRATFESPHQLSVGVRDVFVNGVAVLRNGVHTGATPGRAVRGPGWTGR